MAWMFVLMVLVSGGVWAAPLDIKYGVNNIDVNGDGVEDVVVRMRWENGNAHSFDRYMIGVKLDGTMYEVPLGEGNKYDFRTVESVDCMTEDDLTFYKKFEFEMFGKKSRLRVNEYAREGNDNTVFKTVYDLSVRQDTIVGFPKIWMKKNRRYPLGKNACDVREFIKE